MCRFPEMFVVKAVEGGAKFVSDPVLGIINIIGIIGIFGKCIVGTIGIIGIIGVIRINLYCQDLT